MQIERLRRGRGRHVEGCKRAGQQIGKGGGGKIAIMAS
jgi:hypothetical protein